MENRNEQENMDNVINDNKKVDIEDIIFSDEINTEQSEIEEIIPEFHKGVVPELTVGLDEVEDTKEYIINNEMVIEKSRDSLSISPEVVKSGKWFLNKQIMGIVFSILILLMIVVGLTYANFSQEDSNTNNQVVVAGDLNITYTNGNTISGDLLPISNEEAMLEAGYSFTIENTGSLTAEYLILIYNNQTGDTSNYLGHSNLYIQFNDETPKLITELTKQDPAVTNENTSKYIISSGVLAVGEDKNCEVKIWLKADAEEDVIGKKVNMILDVEAYVNDSTRTVVSGDINVDYNTNMIPVAYTSTGATVKADITNTDANYKWFDYSTSGKRWANAVLVIDSKRETYKNAGTGTAIAEADVLVYLVYIPRYRYELFNAENGTAAVQTINIAFENNNTTKSTGSTDGTWLTHPAFTFGETELNGIWVGKFENSAEEGSSCYTASSSANCNVTNITPRVKPNKNSWRSINVSKMFTTNQYFKSNPIYGINNSSIDSHMMKNMEWGAVAYLTQSQYGKNSELYINNYRAATYSNTMTGCSSGTTNLASVTACSYPYPNMTANGTGASTTGTIYGIYDMSGASDEYTMGNMVNASGAFQTVYSGFATTWGANNIKYYDSYAYDASSYTTFSRGKLGDTTREMLTCTNSTNCGWNSDSSIFPALTMAWFIRGGHANDGTRAGVFYFNYADGGVDPYTSSRVVFAIE